ncbi:MAG: acetylglutamate kinase [Bryobacterales bacterium]|nr:acetylglutamate kinase [Bryobacterales bacterium]
MTLLIKLGGTLLDSQESRARLAGEIRELVRAGHRVVVVHGGGKQMTRFLDAQGIKSSFVNGLRFSSPEVIDALLKVVAGSVNKQLVAALRAVTVAAVGVSGVDGELVEAERLSEELGAVGRPVLARVRLLESLLDGGFTPVIACVGGDSRGNIYNVNADQMASICAAAFPVDQLLFLTDVEGVLDAAKQPLRTLDTEDCARLIAEGVAVGGMQAKLEAVCRALADGVKTVRILPGFRAGVLRDALSGVEVGTAIHKA